MDKAESHIEAEKKNNAVPLVIGVVLVLVLLGGIGGVLQNKKGELQSGKLPGDLSTSPVNATGDVLIYGNWMGNNSVIKAYDIESKENYILATLPQSIKRVTAVMPDVLYYINETNANDHGKEIVKYTLNDKMQSPIIKADDGYGIDDYLISQNGRYITTWEVKLAEGASSLYGGNSRVYSVDLNSPAQKQLLYNETTDKLVHYPRAITNDGSVITDMFLPNSGPGWAYGMSVSDFSGQKQDITAMVNGTYGRQPRSSYDGTQLVFAGYDGAFGSGTELSRGMRQSIARPNTVEILSPQNFMRTKLDLSNQNIYDDARFDRDGKHVFISQVSDANNKRNTKLLLYDLNTKKAQEVPTAVSSRGLAVLSDGKVLVAALNTSAQAMGNMGETYQYLVNKFQMVDMVSSQTTDLLINDSNTNFIGVFPSRVMSQSVMSRSNVDSVNKESLQLHTFQLKASLLQDRVRLQSFSKVAADLAVPNVAPSQGQPSMAQPSQGQPGEDNNNDNGNDNNGQNPPGMDESEAQN